MPYIDNHKLFILNANCLPTKGFQRNVLIDTFFGKYYFIPEGLLDFLSNHRSLTIYEIKKLYDFKYNEIIDEYITFLIENDLICFVENPNDFPKLNTEYKTPSHINYVIIDMNQDIDYQNIIDYINFIGCKSVVINCTLFEITLELVKKHISYFENTGVLHLEFYSKSKFERNDLIEIFLNENRLKRFVLFESKIDSYYSLENGLGREIINFKKKLEWNQPIKINPNEFIINFSFYSESQKQHPYFNRKLYIGINGEIKNTPECIESHGNIHQIKNHSELLKIIENEGFQKYWSVHKEVCDVCKDCELRYMCLDNRLPYQRNKNEWFHKTECNYNPYISKWQGEEGYKTLEECGVISNENGFLIDHEKIAKINQELWEETIN